MSALLRFINRNNLSQNVLATTIRNGRFISTSQKNRETMDALATPDAAKTKNEFTVATKKNWVSYGFDMHNEGRDRSATKASFFVTITLCIVWGTFVWAYAPDPLLRDWAQREGYLELRRRENAGLELISPNYVDPEKINLPSDEELGSTEIII